MKHMLQQPVLQAGGSSGLGLYTIGHPCKQRKLHVLVLQEGEEGDSTAHDRVALDSSEENINLSVNSVVGLTSMRMMNIRGYVGNQEVIVLVDSGATHNFISMELVRKLGLLLTETDHYGVVLGTGLSVQGRGICRGVVLMLPTIQIINDFLPLELGSSKVILGMQWLSSVGNMIVNWNRLTMEFTINGQQVVLQGDPSLCNASGSLQAMIKALEHGGDGVLVELNNLDLQPNALSSTPPETIQSVLTKYDSVFHMPEGLLPARSVTIQSA